MKLAVVCQILIPLSMVGSSAAALMPNVDLRDLVRYGSSEDQTHAASLIQKINANPAAFGLPVGSSYLKAAPTAVGQNSISTAEVQNQMPDGSDLFLVFTQDNKVILSKVHLDALDQPISQESTDLTQHPPIVQIDIMNRQIAVFEKKSGFLKFAPATIGSLVRTKLGDETSPYRSLSSTFSNAYLSRSKSELSRTKPDYYAGRPFLRIIDENQDSYGGFTPFGVHYQIAGVLQRGFVSNGCFRLRDIDLFELSNIVFFTRQSGVPLVVVTSTQNGNRHPYPLIQSWFNVPEVTLDPHGKPVLKTDEHGLFVFDRTKGNPVELLKAGGY